MPIAAARRRANPRYVSAYVHSYKKSGRRFDASRLPPFKAAECDRHHPRAALAPKPRSELRVGSTPHLERERRPFRFVVHAIAAHRCHIDKLYVPPARTTQTYADDPLGVAPRAHLLYRLPVVLTTGDHELLHHGLSVYQTTERERVADVKRVRVRDGHQLGRITERRGECIRAPLADLKDGFDMLLVALPNRAVELTTTSPGFGNGREPILLQIAVEIVS